MPTKSTEYRIRLTEERAFYQVVARDTVTDGSRIQHGPWVVCEDVDWQTGTRQRFFNTYEQAEILLSALVDADKVSAIRDRLARILRDEHPDWPDHCIFHKARIAAEAMCSTRLQEVAS